MEEDECPAAFTQAVTILQEVKSTLQTIRDVLEWSLRGDLKPAVCPGLLFDQKGFSTFHTKFYDKSKCSEKFF